MNPSSGQLRDVFERNRQCPECGLEEIVDVDFDPEDLLEPYPMWVCRGCRVTHREKGD